MRRYLIYVDSSVVGGCEDQEFAEDSRRLWDTFTSGQHTMAVSRLMIREIAEAPEAVRMHLKSVPPGNQIVIEDTDETRELAQAYMDRGILGEGSRSDAEHVALATVAGVDLLASWNFKHLVNLGRIRLFNAVNMERGYGTIEIRMPKEVLDNEEDL